MEGRKEGRKGIGKEERKDGRDEAKSVKAEREEFGKKEV